LAVSCTVELTYVLLLCIVFVSTSLIHKRDIVVDFLSLHCLEVCSYHRC
jgi:hypothetical protein